MIKPLILLLLIPISALKADQSGDLKLQCFNLAKAFKEYDLKVQKMGVRDTDENGKISSEGTCSPLMQEKIKDQATKVSPAIDLSDTAKKTIDDSFCDSLAEIDLKIAQASLKLNHIQGFEKLRTDIIANQERTSKLQPKKAKISAGNFIEALTVARDLELLTNQGKEDDFLKEIAKIEGIKVPGLVEATTTTVEDLKSKIKDGIKSVCDKEKMKRLDVCKKDEDGNLKFKPSDQTIAALQKLVQDETLSKKTLVNWQNALSVKKSGTNEAYSFSKMYEDLDFILTRNGGEEKREAKGIEQLKSETIDLSKEQIEAIKSLPLIEENPIFDFSKAKADSEQILLYQGYKDFLKSSQKRMDLELKEKFNFIREQLKNKSAGAKSEDFFNSVFNGNENCTKKDVTAESIKVCISYCEKENNSFFKQNEGSDTLKSFLESNFGTLKTSINFSENLKSSADNCFKEPGLQELKESTSKKESLVIPECAKNILADDLNAEKIKINEEIKGHELIKKMILEQNSNDIRIRDFAQNKLRKECNGILSQEISSVENYCDAPGTIPSELQFLEINAKGEGIFLVDEVNYFSKAGEINSKNSIDPCTNFPISDDLKSAICFEKKTQDEQPATQNPSRKPVASDPSDLTVTPEEGDYHSPARDAALAGLGGTLGTIAGALFAPPPNYFFSTMPSPYGYSSSYGYGYPMMGFSDQLLFDARTYGGYGYYMPTPGLTPYSSLPSSKFFTGR